MPEINHDALDRVTEALAAFRSVYDFETAAVRNGGSMDEFAYNVAAEGIALAVAVAALLDKPRIWSPWLDYIEQENNCNG